MNLNDVADFNFRKAYGLLHRITTQAGEIVLSHFMDTGKLHIRKKGSQEIVTDADIAVSNFLSVKLKESYPEIPVFSEETATGNFDDYKIIRYAWVIDPIDGTGNFSKGIENFAISIALVYGLQPVLGYVFDPITGKHYSASVHETRAPAGESNMHVSSISKPAEALVYVNLSHENQMRVRNIHLIQLLSETGCQVKVLGSAVNDILRVARGVGDVYSQYGLKPWDTAASVLIARKSGAVVTTLQGNQWDILSPSILIANAKLHSALLKQLGNR